MDRVRSALATNPKKCVKMGIQWRVKCEEKKSDNIHKVWRNKLNDDQLISIQSKGSHITKDGVIALDNDPEILVGKVTRTVTPLTKSINSELIDSYEHFPLELSPELLILKMHDKSGPRNENPH